MKKNILTLIIKTAGILLTAWVLLAVLDGIFTPKYITENRDGNVTAEFYDVETPLDVVFFGSSTVYNAVAPDLLWEKYGFTSYTRANASQTLWQSYYLIRDTVKNNRPKVITLDMSFMKYGEDFFEEASNRKAIDGMRLSPDKMMCARASMWKEESLYSYIFPVLRFHSRWDELKGEDYRYAIKRPQVTYDGFIPEFGRVEHPEEFDPIIKDDFSFPAKSEKYLEMIIDYCAKEDIPLLLMKTPTFINTWVPEYDRQLETIAGEHENCDYVNFDESAGVIGLKRDEDYIDGHSHLNVDGAEKFSGFFGQYIRDRYDLPDHRGDDTYSTVWDDRYTRYCVDIQNHPQNDR
ncbi:MAG: hypothetical protein J5842_00840 [Lachnospiraceae bacterium]|nr:hypothetical protein [Lachnospiraceae bacterium]